MIVSIHQSQFLPWIPYFYKIIASDVFVMLDDVEFSKNGVQNRNQIKTPQGRQWLTLNITNKSHQLIADVALANPKTLEKLLKTISQNYKKAPYFAEVFPYLESIFSEHKNNLHTINKRFIFYVLQILGFQGKIIESSSLHITTKKQQRLLDILRATNANAYIMGGGVKYVRLEDFGVLEVFLSRFVHKPYTQQWGDFMGELSILDLMFNELPNMANYLQECGSLQRIH